jgi:transcriptional regulator with XRE-family HTH domain
MKETKAKPKAAPQVGGEFTSIAPALRAARKAAGMTQREAAEACGKHFQWISYGESEGLVQLTGIAEVLAAYRAEGVTFTITFPPGSSDVRYVVGRVDRLPEPEPKPDPKKYGWHEKQGFDDEPSGWMFEGGEEAYEAALKEWEKNQKV